MPTSPPVTPLPESCCRLACSASTLLPLGCLTPCAGATLLKAADERVDAALDAATNAYAVSRQLGGGWGMVRFSLATTLPYFSHASYIASTGTCALPAEEQRVPAGEAGAPEGVPRAGGQAWAGLEALWFGTAAFVAISACSQSGIVPPVDDSPVSFLPSTPPEPGELQAGARGVPAEGAPALNALC